MHADLRHRRDSEPSVHVLALEELLAGVADLPAEERASLGRKLYTYSTPGRFMKEPNAQAERLSTAVAQLQKEYETSLPPAEMGTDATADDSCLPRWSGASLAVTLFPVH